MRENGRQQHSISYLAREGHTPLRWRGRTPTMLPHVQSSTIYVFVMTRVCLVHVSVLSKVFHVIRPYTVCLLGRLKDVCS